MSGQGLEVSTLNNSWLLIQRGDALPQLESSSNYGHVYVAKTCMIHQNSPQNRPHYPHSSGFSHVLRCLNPTTMLSNISHGTASPWLYAPWPQDQWVADSLGRWCAMISWMFSWAFIISAMFWLKPAVTPSRGEMQHLARAVNGLNTQHKVTDQLYTYLTYCVNSVHSAFTRVGQDSVHSKTRQFTMYIWPVWCTWPMDPQTQLPKELNGQIGNVWRGKKRNIIKVK